MKPNITHLSPRAVLYARATGPYSVGSAQAWRQIRDWLVEKERQADVVAGYGWFRDDPNATNPFLQRYDACIELLPGLSSDFRAGIGRQTLPGGTYLIHLPAGSARADIRHLELSNDVDMRGANLEFDAGRSLLERITLDPAAGIWTAASHVLVPVTDSKADAGNDKLRVA